MSRVLGNVLVAVGDLGFVVATAAVAVVVVVVLVVLEAASLNKISRREFSGRNTDSPNLKMGSNNEVEVRSAGRTPCSTDGVNSTLRGA